MSSLPLIVHIVDNRTDCFVRLPKSFVESHLVPLSRRSTALQGIFFPVKLTKNGGSSRCFAGASIVDYAHRSTTLECSPIFARDNNLVDGDEVTVATAMQGKDWVVATKLEVCPANIDESEVIERNAFALQASLMQSIRVLSPFQRVSLQTASGLRAQVVVSNNYASPAGFPSYALTDGTELLVAVKVRTTDRLIQNSKDAPQCGNVRLLSSNCLPMPLLEAIQQEDKGPAHTSKACLFVSQALAASLSWSHDLEVGLFNIRALSTVSVPEKALAASGETTSKDEDISSLVDSAFLRRFGCTCRVRVVKRQGTEFPDHVDTVSALAGSDSWAFLPCLPLGVLSTPTNCFVKPKPEAQYCNASRDAVRVAFANAAMGSTSPPSSEALRSVQEVREVHGAVTDEMLTHLRPLLESIVCRPHSSPGNLLVLGPRGSGRSTIVRVCADVSGRHVVHVDCAGPSSALNEEIESAICEANLCSPAVIVLDAFDSIASSLAQGQSRGPTSLSPASDFRLQALLMHPQRIASADILVVAVAHEWDTLQPSLKLPFCFPTVIKVSPALVREARAALIRQELQRTFDQPQTNTKSVSQYILDTILPRMEAKTENYAVADVVAVCAKVRRWYVLDLLPQLRAVGTAFNDNETRLLDPLIADGSLEKAMAECVPLSHVGIKFMDTSNASHGDNKTPNVTWDDAGGMVEAKAALHDMLVLPSKFPQLFEKLPLKSKSGVLLHGASGCGKTYLMSVVAAAEKLHCIVVNGPEIFGKYIGTSEQKIREIFESAQSAAPCVVFFDEFDAVAPRRGNSNTGVTDRVVNQLLCYLDGVEGRKDVYVVAATSRPDLIDPALLRPGRLDQQVLCPLPDQNDRIGVFSAHLRKASSGAGQVTGAADGCVPGIQSDDLLALANATDGWTCADIAGLVASAHSSLIQRTLHLSAADLLKSATENYTTTQSDGEASFVVLKSFSTDAKRDKFLNESVARIAAPASEDEIKRESEQQSGGAASAIPLLSREDIENAMKGFRRSRESEQHARTKSAATELKHKIAALRAGAGTRQTSA